MQKSVSSFDVDRFKKLLTTRYIGRNVIYKYETATTMDDAKEGAQNGTPNGTVYLAETQTKARGTRNHRWDALSLGNLYISIILHRPAPVSPESEVERLDLESMSGIAILKALQKLHLENLSLKWPNDLWIYGHKLCGSLAEDVGFLSGEYEGKYAFILGIGVNVNADVRRHPELHLIATSVKCEKIGQQIDREELFATYCNILEDNLAYSHDDLYDEVMKYQLFKFGDNVKVQKVFEGGSFLATLEDIQRDWRLVVKDKTGMVRIGLKEFSLRPVKTKTIYIYHGHLAVTWSAMLLLKAFNSLMDTSVVTVDSLNDSRFKEGLWRNDALMIVIGEIDYTKVKSDDDLDFIVDFVKNGGSAFVVRSGAQIFYPNLNLKTDINEKNSEIFTETVQIFPPDNDNFNIHSASAGQKFTLSPELTQGSEVWGYYGNNKSDDVSITVNTYGSGLCAIFGFNVEITYTDLDIVSESNEELEHILRQTVFQRDDLIRHIVSRCLKM